jgi:death-on-curing protein
VHGGVAGIAGAICFYFCQSHVFENGNKRTAVEAATAFLMLNGWTLSYPKTATSSALVDLVEACGRGEKTKDEVRAWFEVHKATP